MDTTQLEKLRPCGRLETYSTARHHLGFYNNVGLTATYTTPSTSGSSLEISVYAALHHVIADHPNLSAIPIHEDKSFPEVYFVRLPEVDLSTCVEFRTREAAISPDNMNDEDLDEMLHKQHSRNFENKSGRTPYWRLVITTSPKSPSAFNASWFFHHALADGTSAMLFHESFVEGLNAASINQGVDRIVSSPHTPLPPPLEELHPMTMSWSFFLRALAGSVLPSYFAQRSPQLWTGGLVPAEAVPTKSKHHSLAIPASTTKAFATKCRSENTSVTAALSALIAVGISERIQVGTLGERKEIRVDTPISLRPFLDVPAGRMINAITNASFTYTMPSRAPGAGQPEGEDNKHAKLSWEQARQMKNGLRKEVEKKGADNLIALFKYVSDMPAFFLSQLGKPRPTSVELSNLGVWRGRTGTDGQQGKWKIGRMAFSQSVNHTSAPISVSVVTGGDGCLSLTFCCANDDAWIADVIEELESNIAILAHGE
ncbi:hypothetical protein EKO04_010233 [Ascochyta lentis]|uniref:Alcohol acetyltransferase n=1 Tax=Ascochyta lentis TaxID=205686 RepID=A0A8H7IVR5_9PLEO|nr:hypothetical protein EKO04_010233 [Ascochyta lentis]